MSGKSHNRHQKLPPKLDFEEIDSKFPWRLLEVSGSIPIGEKAIPNIIKPDSTAPPTIPEGSRSVQEPTDKDLRRRF